MPKLNQIIAIANGQRTRTKEQVTKVYQRVQKASLFDGLVRTYKSQREDEHDLPPEQKLIQAQWRECLDEAIKHWSQLLNVTATQDTANCKAIGTIAIDGDVIMKDVPVTHLLFLEKHIVNVRTFLLTLPVLDASEAWTWDSNRSCYITAPQRKIRTRKVPQVLVKYEATPEHAAQTERFDEDIVVGEWETVLLSGRIPKQDKERMVARVDKLIEGIKLAREQANCAMADSVEIARPLFAFIIEGKTNAGETG